VIRIPQLDSSDLLSAITNASNCRDSDNIAIDPYGIYLQWRNREGQSELKLSCFAAGAAQLIRVSQQQAFGQSHLRGPLFYRWRSEPWQVLPALATTRRQKMVDYAPQAGSSGGLHRMSSGPPYCEMDEPLTREMRTMLISLRFGLWLNRSLKPTRRAQTSSSFRHSAISDLSAEALRRTAPITVGIVR
jgi:hypothetical protein